MDFIYEEEGFLPSEICKKMIEKFEDDDNKFVGMTKEGTNLNNKKTTDLIINSLKAWHVESDYLTSKSTEMLSKYRTYLSGSEFNQDSKRIQELFSRTYFSSFLINKYTTGGFYRWHYDATPINSRILTVVVYLNDIESGIGGTTDFKNGRRIQPKTGKLLVFPSSWTHLYRDKKLENGSKYVLTWFVYGDANKCKAGD